MVERSSTLSSICTQIIVYKLGDLGRIEHSCDREILRPVLHLQSNETLET